MLAEDEPERAVGRALVWAQAGGVGELHLLVEDAAPAVARRASAFSPPPQVWQVEGRKLVPAGPVPHGPEPPLDPRAAAFADVILAAGADPVVEHGMLVGEVLGLEVARVLIDPVGPRLEVGVGKHDRLAHRLVQGDQLGREALAQVVATVRAYRRSGAEPHPLNRLAPERWLRSRLVAEPELVGAAHLAPVPSPVRRDDLRQPSPAPAAGVDHDERPLLVVCSTGIDLDLVPTAADARLADGRDPRLLLVVPQRDDHPSLHALVGALAEPAEVVTVPDDWRRP